MLITISDLLIDNININYTMQFAEVGWRLVDDTGQTWKNGLAIFWATMPPPELDPDGNPLPYPENWFLLPAGYLPNLLALRNDADTALTAKYLQ